jgi:hypothetical protein
MQMRGIIQYNPNMFFAAGEEHVNMSAHKGDVEPVQSTIDMVKLLRVYGGCLGVERRRRTWQAAISPGQVSSNR